MSIESYSVRLRELVDDFVNCRIQIHEYRMQRRTILCDIDKTINGLTADVVSETEQEATDHGLHGLFDKIV